MGRQPGPADEIGKRRCISVSACDVTCADRRALRRHNLKALIRSRRVSTTAYQKCSCTRVLPATCSRSMHCFQSRGRCPGGAMLEVVGGLAYVMQAAFGLYKPAHCRAVVRDALRGPCSNTLVASISELT